MLGSCIPYKLEPFVSDIPAKNCISNLKLMNPIVLYSGTRNISNKARTDFIGEVNEVLNQSLNKFYKGDSPLGFLELKTDFRSTKANYFWFTTSILTLFVLNIVGYPAHGHDSEVALTVNIYDKNQLLVQSFNTTAKKSAYSAMWWGYQGQGVFKEGDHIFLTRASRLKAMMAGFENIIARINDQSLQLCNELSSEVQIDKRKMQFNENVIEVKNKINRYKIGETKLPDVLNDNPSAGIIKILSIDSDRDPSTGKSTGTIIQIGYTRKVCTLIFDSSDTLLEIKWESN
jgi:hypothetical protein